MSPEPIRGKLKRVSPLLECASAPHEVDACVVYRVFGFAVSEVARDAAGLFHSVTMAKELTSIVFDMNSLLVAVRHQHCAAVRPENRTKRSACWLIRQYIRASGSKHH
jgi:hypothetical protein